MLPAARSCPPSHIHPRALGHTNTQPRALGHTNTQPRAPGHTNTQPRAPEHTNTQPRAPEHTNTQPRALGPINTQPRALGHTNTQPRALGPTNTHLRALGHTKNHPRALRHISTYPRALGHIITHSLALGYTNTYPHHVPPSTPEESINIRGEYTITKISSCTPSRCNSISCNGVSRGDDSNPVGGDGTPVGHDGTPVGHDGTSVGHDYTPRGCSSVQVHPSLLLLLFLVLTRPFITGATHERVINCECSTTECVASGVHTCSTSHMCYSQLLDRCDGTHPVIRGCINDGGLNTLLCLNLRPSVDGSWPYLVCCNTHFCNRDVSPVPPEHLLMQEFREECGEASSVSEPPDDLTILLVGVGVALILIITISAAAAFILTKCRSTYSQTSHVAFDVGLEKLKPPLLEAPSPPLLLA
ncbi:uncharacterized protein [Procambarus clarkii]|uniref:uncharacterized protein isoform X2 n=1 Tax=Procambarus clarkii TaxID=6728 RepID=UPI003744AE03